MTAPTMTPEAAAYLAAVEHELADLPADERAELLEDLGLHLLALAEDDDDRPVAVRLGSTAAYAAELRVAAGLPPRAATTSSRWDRLTVIPRRVMAHQLVRGTRDFLPQLQPAWWVLRGYLVVVAATVLAHAGAPWKIELRGGLIDDVPFPATFDSKTLGAVLVAAAIVISVRLGLASLGRQANGVVVAVNVLIVLVGAWLAVVAHDRLPLRQLEVQVVARGADYPLQSSHGAVTNIYPFSADGKPLTGVLLYDQDGRPLHAAAQEWWKDGCARVLAQPKAADGVPVPQSYPQQYVLDPSGVATYGGPVQPGQCHPLAPPAVQLPVFPQRAR